jgi:CheY-like chemotaxis protein
LSVPSQTRAPEPQPGDGFGYEKMAAALISSAALTARTHLDGDPGTLQDVRARVRYCQLLSTRLGLSKVESDGVIVAAWISSLEDEPDLPELLETPYGLDEILAPDDSLGTEMRLETQILGLVRCYQELKKSDPESCKDVDWTRDRLYGLWASPGRGGDMLETFLQVLMDEEFLSKLDRASGRILIIDPAEARASNLAPPLSGDGYEVDVVPSAAAADDVLADFTPDLIISNMDLPQVSGLRFCQKTKRAARTSNIPFIILVPEGGEKHGAECLRVGADDVVVKPVDLELLFIKIQRLLSVPAANVDKAGVSGSLSDMSFTDMIQILCAGSKNTEIRLVRGDEEGLVWVKAGDIVHAVVGDAAGEPAFYELMRWDEGEFTTQECTEFPEVTIERSAIGLLMEGARLADEGAIDDAEA